MRSWFEMLELLVDHPNVTFVLGVALAIVGIGIAPSHVERDALVIGGIGVADWLRIGTIAVVCLVASAAVAAILATVTPRQTCRRLAVALIGWRLFRFTYCLVALFALLWIAISTTLLLLHLKRSMSWIERVGRSGLTIEHEGPWLGKLMCYSGIAVVIALVFFPLMGVLKDLGHLLLGTLQIARYKRWVAASGSTIGAPGVTLGTENQQVHVLLISDLHGTAGEQETTIEGTRHDAGMRKFLADEIAKRRPRLIIGAGDMTDQGDRKEWQRLRELLPENIRTIVAPGNHDVNFKGLKWGHWSRHFFSGLDIDSRWRVFNSYLESELHEHIAEVSRRSDLRAVKLDPNKHRDTHFPVLYEDRDLGLAVLVLNSNRRPSSSPITNALGYVGTDQLATARELLERRTLGYSLIVVMHHHVFPPPTWPLFDMFLVCIDAKDVLELAFQHRASLLVHGHEHMPYVYTVTRNRHTLRIVSLGSALYDAKGPCAAEVKGPSVFGLTVKQAKVIDIFAFPDQRARSARLPNRGDVVDANVRGEM